MDGRDRGKRTVGETSQQGADAKKARTSGTDADIDCTDIIMINAVRSRRGRDDASGTGGGVGDSWALPLPRGRGASATQDVPQGRRLAATNMRPLNGAGYSHLVNRPSVAAPPHWTPRPPSEQWRLNAPHSSVAPLLQPARPPIQYPEFAPASRYHNDEYLQRAVDNMNPELWARLPPAEYFTSSAIAPAVVRPTPPTLQLLDRPTPPTLQLLDRPAPRTLQLLDTMDRVNSMSVHPASAAQQAVAASSSGSVFSLANQQSSLLWCPYCHVGTGAFMLQPQLHCCLCARCLVNPDAVCWVCGFRGNAGAP